MGQNVLVIGSINMDFIIRTPKLPDVDEEIEGLAFTTMQGGKGANQAVALSKMGASVTFSCMVGKDPFGDNLLQALKKKGINTELVFVSEKEHTGTVFILVEPKGQHGLVYFSGTNALYGTEKVERLETAIKEADIILTQLEIPITSVQRVITLANKYNVPVVVDAGPPQKASLDLFKGVHILSPNELEASALTGISVTDEDFGSRACARLLASGIDIVALKMGDKGALVADENGLRMHPAFKVDPVDTTGAGDAFTAALTYMIAKGEDLDQAVIYANAAGALAVSKPGTAESLPTGAEIAAFVAQNKRGV